MAALALAMAACSNEDSALENVTPAQPGRMHFTATIAAPSGDATTRTVYTEEGTTIKVKWVVGDMIALVHNGVMDVAEVKTVDDVTGKATIEADITGSPEDNDDVYLAYPADAVISATPYDPFPFTPDQDIFDKVQYHQEGTLEFIQNNLDLRMGNGKLAVSGDKATLKGSVSIPSLICIWKLTLQDESSNALSATKLTFKNNDDTQAKATSTDGMSEYYLCVVPSFIPDPSGTFSFEATVGSDTYTYIAPGSVSLTAGKYYQSTVTMAKQPEVAGSYFTANSSGLKVAFSKGNLQATYNGSTWTWAFAEHQYDYIGNAEGNTKVTDASPYVSGYSGSSTTVDLFGWVGASSTWTGVNKFGITSAGDGYLQKTDGYGNEADESMKAEWNSTNLTITNGGGKTWRTLTGGEGGEWEWIIGPAYDAANPGTNCRASGATVNGVVNARYTNATINTDGTEVNGIILFPDGCKINSSSAKDWGPINTESDWETKCTTAQWTHLEELGCVFLPAAGYRKGAEVGYAGTEGYYWSSSPLASELPDDLNTGSAHNVYFGSGAVVAPRDYYDRYYGFSVRLVRDVPAGSQGTEANDRSYGNQSDLGTWQ